MKNHLSTSNGAEQKLHRALRQLQNTQVLINSLPKKYYLEKRNVIRDIESQIDTIIYKIRNQLIQ
jgi:hypothetical protein